MRTFALVGGLLLALSQQPAWGQLLAACRGDVLRFCQGVAPGGGRLIECMQQHAARLSDACKQAIATADAAPTADRPDGPQTTRTACRGDALRLCPDAVGDATKLKRCMQTHAAELSDGCKTALIAGGEQ